MDAWEYGVIIVTTLTETPPVPYNAATSLRRASLSYLVAGSGTTFYAVQEPWISTLNRAGADGWVEYRREYQTTAPWLTWLRKVIDVDDAIGFTASHNNVSHSEFWMRRPSASGG